MRLLHLTAGAAGMYCGSCLRDNALAAALIARGHDVVLQPLYTPTNPDAPNVSSSRVFFGGVSVYLEQHVPLFRRTPAFLDRLWDSNVVLRFASKRQIKIDPHVLGSMTVSMLRGVEGFQQKEMSKLLQWLEIEPRFDSITLPNSLLIGLARPLSKALRVPIACVLQGEDLFLEGVREPWRGQALELIRRAVANVDVFIAVSDDYRAFMQEYLRIPAGKIRTVALGIDLTGYDPTPVRLTPPYTVGYFGRIAPEKGLHVLADAYRALRNTPGVPPTRLLAGGYLLEEHRNYLARIIERIAGWGLAGEFQYAGAPARAEKIALLHQMDVFSLPTPSNEPKGLSVLEAMACGVPVVQPRRGAFIDILGRTGGGLLVPPDDPAALADALYRLLVDRALAAGFGEAGAAGVRSHYAIERMAQDAEQVYRALGGESVGAQGRRQKA
jgi:glycosyltransferase involved in cell wall biosynthesis